MSCKGERIKSHICLIYLYEIRHICFLHRKESNNLLTYQENQEHLSLERIMCQWLKLPALSGLKKPSTTIHNRDVRAKTKSRTHKNPQRPHPSTSIRNLKTHNKRISSLSSSQSQCHQRPVPTNPANRTSAHPLVPPSQFQPSLLQMEIIPTATRFHPTNPPYISVDLWVTCLATDE